MKIERNIEAERISAVQATREVSASSNGESQAGATASAPLVNLSSEARVVQKLRDAVESSPDIRQEKVKQLREDFQEGKLSVNTAELANILERLLGNA